jgi:hypothetical protein
VSLKGSQITQNPRYLAGFFDDFARCSRIRCSSWIWWGLVCTSRNFQLSLSCLTGNRRNLSLYAWKDRKSHKIHGTSLDSSTISFVVPESDASVESDEVRNVSRHFWISKSCFAGNRNNLPLWAWKVAKQPETGSSAEEACWKLDYGPYIAEGAQYMGEESLARLLLLSPLLGNSRSMNSTFSWCCCFC